MIEKLSDDARKQLLDPLLANRWAMVDGRDAIQKTFEFKNFIDAFGWMTRVAIWAEKWDHHPEWFNVYNTVRVDLSTHDVGGITTWDVELARAMDAKAS